MITKIRIRRFRSIDDMTIQCRQLTTLVGPNDVGKSNIVRALNLFFNGETDVGRPLNFESDYNQNSKARLRKAEEISIDLTFELPKSFHRKGSPTAVIWKKRWRKTGEILVKNPMRYTENSEFGQRSKIPTYLQRHCLQYAPGIKDPKFFADLLGRIYDRLSSTGKKNAQAYEINSFNAGLKGNTLGIIDGLKVALDEDFKVTLPSNLRPVFESLEIKNADGIPLDRRGDGIKVRHIPEMFRYLSELIGKDIAEGGGIKSSHIWVFEEPENNLEYNAAYELIKRLNTILSEKSNIQLVITTHSPVFYGMIPSDGVDELRRYFISRGDKDKFSTTEEIKDDDRLHEEMGMLPLIAAAVAKIKKEKDEVEENVERLLRNSVDLSTATIFVEGKSDKIIFQKVLNVFFPNDVPKIKLVNAEKGGAGSAINSLQAWELNQKNQKNHVQAVALLDKDKEGEKVHKEFSEATGRKQKYTKPMYLLSEGSILSRLSPGYKAIVDLESLLSEDLWKMADKNKWLCERGEKLVFDYCLPEEIKDQIIACPKHDFDRFAGLSADQKIRMKFKFSTKGKIAVSNKIEGMADDSAKMHLENLKPTLERALKFIFDKNNQSDH